MARPRIRRTLVGVMSALALTAPAAMVVSSPATAGSVKRHDVNIYKLEGFVELGGEYPDNEAHEHLICEDGDYAIDGMWKVDSYETPNADDGVYGDRRSVRAVASYADMAAADTEKWHFRFANDGTGRATIKTFIVCVTPETGERAGHTHDISIDRYSLAATAVTGGTETSPFGGCLDGYVAVAPGFRATTGSPRLVGSYPSADARDWRWMFDGSGDVEFYLSCLKTRVSTEQGPDDALGVTHTHDLDLAWLPSTTGPSTSLEVGNDQTLTESAAWRDFAAVGAFYVMDPTTVTYLGMDARGRKRDFKFWNAGAGASTVYTAILSLHKRTSPQLKP